MIQKHGEICVSVREVKLINYHLLESTLYVCQQNISEYTEHIFV